MFMNRLITSSKTLRGSTPKFGGNSRKELNLNQNFGGISINSQWNKSNLIVLNRNYHERVIDHYEKPRNVGSFDRNAKNVGTGTVGAPACGDVMKIQIKYNEETGKIEDAKFKTFGCGSAIASSSLATEWVKGKTLDEACAITNNEIASYLSLPPVKKHCSMLAEDGIKAAVHELKTKLDRIKAEETMSQAEKAVQ
eukprot:TRINITY_DN437_c0_g1_i1.p1 TRINITY_DN437_c0_g1~~TRINITY_DN437_c0_g1_i1.p1  ORF type:complete len:196 (-),score=66.25 TRINITY_DN437_c0_g1_i1:115-702(-)